MKNTKKYVSTTLAITTIGAALMAATPARAEDAKPVTLPMPAMAGPLGLNTNPHGFDAGPLNKIYVTGAVSGLAYTQTHHVAGDETGRGDLSNGQVFIQNADGPVQFMVQAGAYSLPSLGTSYLKADKTTAKTFGYIPQAYIKLVPNSTWSFMAGKLPTLIGAEYTFTYENMNIERGLLWNQENAVTRAVQANYVSGPLSLSLQWGDGFYSTKYNWLTGLASYTLDASNTVGFSAGGNLGKTARSSFVTPTAQNNGQIYDVYYTHTDGNWTISPYAQYTFVPKETSVGINHNAATYGAAVLAKYTFDKNLSLGGRVEYIGSVGSATNGAPNLLYGQGSRAWSVTLTPTYQYDMLFARVEGSYVRASKTVSGSAFGDAGDEKSQGRLMLEAGVLF